MVNDDRISVVMADDHLPLRTRIRLALEEGGCDVRAETASAEEAVRMAIEHQPDVALLDIHMPGNGIQAAHQISREVPGTAIVMLTQSAEDDDLFDSLRAGASGYLLKDTDPALLPSALRSVLRGEAAVPATLVSRILDEFRGPTRRRFMRKSAAVAKLSAREWEVMELLGQGISTEEVARRLFVSPTTVRVHVSAVLRKLSVSDRESAFRLLRDE
ncbi:MAG: response regulator transcription factor [Mycetocola sp.]